MSKAEEIPQLFILSSGRCGSTFLSELLELHPEVLSISEMFMAANTRAFVHRRLDGRTFWEKFAKPSKAMSRTLTPDTCPKEFKFDLAKSQRFTLETLPPILFMALPRLTDEPERLFDELSAVIAVRPVAPLAEHYTFLFEWLCRRLNKKYWVERSGGSLIYAESLIRLFPSAKFVHLFRDGRDVALSLQAYPPLSLLAQSWHAARRFGINLLRPPFRLGDSRLIYYAQDYLTPMHGIEKRLTKTADLRVLGDFWSEMINRGQDAIETLPSDRILYLAYEDLVAAPEARLSELMDFSGIENDRGGWLDLAIKEVRSAQERSNRLTPQQASALDQACRPGLQRLGYTFQEEVAMPSSSS